MINLVLESNIEEVRQKMEKFQGKMAEIGPRAFDPKDWFLRAKEEATRVLFELAETEEQRSMVPRYAETITVRMFKQNAMLWAMERVHDLPADILEAVKGEQMPLWQVANHAQRQQVFEVIYDWVDKKKDLDRYESTQSTEQIAVNIFWVLFGDRSEGRVDKTARLLPHLQRHANEMLAGQGDMDEATAERWLLAVLDAWRGMLLAQGPQAVQEAIREIRRSVGL